MENDTPLNEEEYIDLSHNPKQKKQCEIWAYNFLNNCNKRKKRKWQTKMEPKEITFVMKTKKREIPISTNDNQTETHFEVNQVRIKQRITSTLNQK